MLTARKLGSSGKSVAPIIWGVGEGISFSEQIAAVLSVCAEAQTRWLFIDAGATEEMLAGLSGQIDGWSVFVGMGVERMDRRAADWLTQRLKQIGRQRCEGIVLQGATPGDIKAGGPFHRMIQLRDRGLTDLFILEAEDCAAGEWAVENTPAHAVCVPFGLKDQTAGYRLLETAGEMEVGVIAGPVEKAVWTPPEDMGGFPGDDADMSFVLAHPAVSAVLWPLPADETEARRLIAAAQTPMPEEERQRWWQMFREAVPEPPKTRTGQPPAGIG